MKNAAISVLSEICKLGVQESVLEDSQLLATKLTKDGVITRHISENRS